MRKISPMNESGTLFGWAFGDPSRAGDEEYLDQLRRDALANATQDAASRGFDVEPGTESYTVIKPGDTLADDDKTPDQVIVRSTVKLVGLGSDKVHAEGPMNG
jgi:hypothetical protein